MSSEASTPSPAPSPLALAALAALKRARKRAEEIAAATGTAVIQWEDGRIVRFYPGRKGDAEGGPSQGY
jgi:MYXO-CTERM domain-containing protein